MRLILTFDVGTTAIKGCAFTDTFELFASFNREYQLETPAPHLVQMRPQRYWEAIRQGIQAWIAQGLDPAHVAMIAFTTQGETLIPVDRAGEPLTDAVVWLDDRAQREAESLQSELGLDLFYRQTGLPELGGATPLAKLKWFREERPEIAARTYKYLLLEDYLILRMTGAFATESSLLSSTGYFDINRRMYWAEALSLAGASEGQLPEPARPGQVVGAVSENAARETGLLSGTPVAAGAMDQVAGALGAGNIRPGVLTETTGTCLTLAATIGRPRYDPEHPVAIYTHFDDQYLYLPYNPTAALVLKWFRDQFMREFQKSELRPGEDIYDAMTAQAARVPPLCEGLTLIPHFAGALLPTPQPDLRGAFVGIGLHTTRAHFIRAILEGVAYMLRENVDCLRAAGVPVGEIRSLGGAAKSPLWCQIKASVTNCPIRTMRLGESTSLGAAMLAALAAGMYPSAQAICERFAAVERAYAPDPGDAAAYDAGFTLYRKIVRRLSGLSRYNE